MFDLGTSNVKYGISGEHSPRGVVPLPSQIRRSLQRTKPAPLTTVEWTELLSPLFQHLYFGCLNVKPDERKVLLVENLFFPRSFRDALGVVLFHHLQIPTLLFVPALHCSLIACGVDTGLVVECGEHETTVLPICNHFPVMEGLSIVPVGFASIRRLLQFNLQELFPGLVFSDSNVDDIIQGCARVRFGEHLTSVVSASGNGSFISLSVGTRSQVKCPRNVVDEATDILFHDDGEEHTLQHAVLNALLACDCGDREKLMSNIVLSGGTGVLPGLFQRLKEEIGRVTSEAKEGAPYTRAIFAQLYPVVSKNVCAEVQGVDDFTPDIRAWVGASILSTGNVYTFETNAVSSSSVGSLLDTSSDAAASTQIGENRLRVLPHPKMEWIDNQVGLWIPFGRDAGDVVKSALTSPELKVGAGDSPRTISHFVPPPVSLESFKIFAEGHSGKDMSMPDFLELY